jgi:hypothetical protein
MFLLILRGRIRYNHNYHVFRLLCLSSLELWRVNVFVSESLDTFRGFWMSDA